MNHMNKIQMISRLLLAGLAGAALSLAGCGDVDDPLGPDAGPVDTFTQIYQSSGFQQCSGCHAPGAPGFTDGTEATQDWSSRDSAYMSLTTGDASGLMGNFEDCNGVPLIGDTPETSLLVATLDEDVRADFSLANFPNCNSDTISDMTLKIGGPIPAADLNLLKQWIMDGAPNQ
ncbi:MAG: hypothetical protein Tsb0020_04150 [Haliangiales bacterium]